MAPLASSYTSASVTINDEEAGASSPEISLPIWSGLSHGKIYTTALAAHQAGICVLPVRENGRKMPDLPSWSPYQQNRPSDEEISNWFSQNRTGIGFVTGKVSGNLELFEFDCPDTYEDFKERAAEVGLGDLIDRLEQGYCEQTPGGGTHWFYRCSVIGGNAKLAQKLSLTEHGKQTWKTLIETRGEGGFAVVAPSYGKVHPTGKPYSLRSGSIEKIIIITPEEREDLWSLARTFDQCPDPDKNVVKDPSPGSVGSRPGDLFNQRATWAEILIPHGWTFLYTRNGEEYWCRPGKEAGVSATTNFEGRDLLHVFSSSTCLEAGKNYSKFAAYTYLNHGGDFRAAARDVAGNGHDAPQALDHHQAGFSLTDLGNSERLVAQHGQDLRFCDPLGGWLIWNGSCWESDETGEIVRRAIETVRSISAEAAHATNNWAWQEIVQHARVSESITRIRAMIEMARSNQMIRMRRDAFDTDPYLLTCENGTLDLRTGSLRPHNRQDLITKKAPVSYLADAKCPTWLAFLDRIFAGNQDIITFIQRGIGYSLTGDVGAQCMFFLYGTGGNGKSTFVETLMTMLGAYAQKAPTEMLMKRDRSGSIPNDIARLVGARLVVTSEVEEGRRMDETLVKNLTGGDKIPARLLYKEYFEFSPTHKIWMYGNHKPEIQGTDDGIWRRIHLIPFTVTIPEEERDPCLKDRLRDELPGILRWAVEGCRAWGKDGLRPPEEVREATRDYRKEMDVVGQFLNENFYTDPTAGITSREFHIAFDRWCDINGEAHISAKQVGRILKRKGFTNSKSGIKRWHGLALRPEARDILGSPQGLIDSPTTPR